MKIGWFVGMTLGLTLAGQGASASVFNPETFTLDNGMEVVVIPNHRAPVVSHWVWYRVGTADSPLGSSGLPHFLEHLMFKGTETIAPGEFSKIVARNGGNDNAVTSYDFTAYFQNIARDRLGLVMEMEADRMTNLVLTDREVLPERDVVIEERRSRVENEPAALLGEQLTASQFLHHPYRLPVIGWMHEMELYDLTSAVEFYNTWYAPNNAILIVAGDVTAAELRPLAESTYGQIERRDIPERVRTVEPPQLAERRIQMSHERVQEPSITRSYLAPSFNQDDKTMAYALEVLSELFGSGGTSRLYSALVVDQGLATGAGSYYRGTSLDATNFRIYAAPRPGTDLDTLEAALDAQIELLVDDGVTEEELARVKKRMLAQAVYARDSLSSSVRAFGAALTTGLTVADVEAWPERISAVTADQILAAAKMVFQPTQSVTARLLPKLEG